MIPSEPGDVHLVWFDDSPATFADGEGRGSRQLSSAVKPET